MVTSGSPLREVSVGLTGLNLKTSPGLMGSLKQSLTRSLKRTMAISGFAQIPGLLAGTARR